MDSSSIESIIILVTLVSAVIALGLLAFSASTYREKFERNFVFNGAAWGIIIAEIIMIIGFGIGAVALEDRYPSSLQILGQLFLFTHVGGSVWFYFGLLVLMLTFVNNVSQSNFKWGMYQNIMQTILVTVFSVFIILGTIFVGQKIKEVVNKNS
tara:strand:- start:114 stop:575 length:462 start_codon:yes stop_codon:yes gene_type:complete